MNAKVYDDRPRDEVFSRYFGEDGITTVENKKLTDL